MKKLLFALLTLVLTASVCAPLSVQAQEETETATVPVSESGQQENTENSETEPSETEPTATEPVTTEPTAAESETTEPATSVPDETSTTAPAVTEPTTVQPKDETEEKEIEDIVSLEGKTIMIVGNSMVYYGNCVILGDAGKADYGYFYQLVASNGEEATVLDYTYGGKKLSYIYDKYLKKLSAAELAKVDYVVLSEANQENDDLLGTCKKIMALFPETTQFRFMCHPMMYDKNILSLLTGVADLRASNMEIVDWGKMVYDIYTGAVKVPSAALTYDRCSFIKDNLGYKNGSGSISSGSNGDNKHPNPLSGYIAAQMLYTSITNRSAVLSDYSFCDNSEIHRLFNLDAFANAHYTGTKTTNFNQIFRSPQDMVGLQKLIDTYLAAEGRHPLTVLDAVDPTCTSGGLTQGSYCAVCGEVVRSQEYIQSKGGHKLVYDKAVDATCTKDGKTAGIHCSVCKEVIIAQKTKRATGHSKADILVKASVNADGSKKTVCTLCNEELSNTKINKIQTVKLSDVNYIYDGKVKKPKVTVIDSAGKALTKGTDYSLSYASGRKKIGDYTVTVNFKGNYSGSKTLTFKIRAGVTEKITAKSYLKAVKLSWNKVANATGYRIYMYNSSTKKYEKVADTKKTAYTVKNLTSGKKYKFRVKAYTKSASTVYYASGYKSVSALTKPAKVSLKSVKSSQADQATLNWKAVTGANGYQVIYSETSSFKTAEKVTVKKQKTKKTTVKNLTSYKTYYFKVRAYKTLNGKTVYGPYSAVKSVTVK